jgi:endonuclease/exonuclease/phosphatase family metal-dependent hydrolase
LTLSVLNVRVATYNISGGEKTFEEFPHDTQQSRQEALTLLVARLDADILCLQEVSQYTDADGTVHSLMAPINQAGSYSYSFFASTVSMASHMQVRKDVMVKGIFNDWRDWSKGNALHSRIPFARLGNPAETGIPRNIPLYQPKHYKGTRDTDPRYAMIGRLKASPFPFVANLHLTTLLGERSPHALPEKVEEAQILRYQQVRRFLDLVRNYILQRDEPLILVGDFNAPPDEFCLAHLLESESGFLRLAPENEGPSHAGSKALIDHIFFYPRDRLVDYTCFIEEGNLSYRASDHLPVLAELQIK